MKKVICLFVVFALMISMLPEIDLTVEATTHDNWINFLSTGAFKEFLTNDYQEHQDAHLEYAIFDLNKDGASELLIQDKVEAPFYFTWLFAWENGNPKLVYEDYGYGMYRYSNKFNMVLTSAGFKPFSGTGEAPFYSLVGTTFAFEFNILQNSGTFYYVDDTEEQVLSDDERAGYFEDVVWLDYIAVSDVLANQPDTPPVSTIEPPTASDDAHRDEDNIESDSTNVSDPTIQAINALLTGMSYYTQEGTVSEWTEDEICNIIHSKLLDCHDPYLHEMEQPTYSDAHEGHLRVGLSFVQQVTKDAFGCEFPVDKKSSDMFVSGEELVYIFATGESPELAVQDYYKHEDIVIATGTAIHNYNANSEFEGYFQVTLKVNPSSIYGYTLLTFKQIETNQLFNNISAVASSELTEGETVHSANNVIDGNLSTVWSEGIGGVGIGEWIKIQTTDGSKMHISAIDFALGHQKSQQHENNNGWPLDLLIECEGDYSQKVEFYGMDDCILLDVPQNASWVKFTILDARAGSKYEDTCISEIVLRGVDGAPYFQEYVESIPPEDVLTENALVIYSDYSNLSIREGSTITLSAGVLTDGKLSDDVSGINFQIENSSILAMSTTGVKGDYRYVKLKGIAEGTTTVVFTDSNTGYTAKVPITVYDDNYLSYTLSSVPTQYIEKYPTNIYNANGLYVDSYKYTVNDDQSATVSFDVYNTNYIYGAVEVYDENGNMKDAVLIEKMTSSNTSIKEALWDNIGYLVRDIVDGDLLSYRQESGYSKKTSVSVTIPRNGYIKITNDSENSLIVGLVNSVDGLMSMASLAGDIKNFDVNSKEFSKKLTKKLVTDQIYIELIKDGSKASKDLWKNVAKETFITAESMGSFTDTITKNIDELKLGSIIADTAADFGWDIGENVFTYFAGPAGTALNIMFTIGKLENLIIQQNDLIQLAGVGAIYIQNQGGGFRACQQIKVENTNSLSSDTALNVFTVTLDSELLDIIKDVNPEVYEAMTAGITRTYNISLIKSGEETQPDGKVTVYIPISDDFKALAYAGDLAGKIKIYRVEEDGGLTEMDVEIDDGCFVFTTDHFSLYTIVGYDFPISENQNDSKDDNVDDSIDDSKDEGKINVPLIVGIVSAVIVIVGAFWIFVLKRKKKSA